MKLFDFLILCSLTTGIDAAQPAKLDTAATIVSSTLVGNDATVSGNNKTLTTISQGSKFQVSRTTHGLWLQLQRKNFDPTLRVAVVSGSTANNQRIVFIPRNWQYVGPANEPATFIQAIFFKQPGHYKLFLIPVAKELPKPSDPQFAQKPVLSFTVVAAPVTFLVKDIVVILLAAMAALIALSALIIIGVKKRGRQRAQAAKLQAAMTENELEAIRAKLNPHFVYNALANIQNLINNNNVQLANQYLATFARLTRNIVDGRLLWSIQEELDLLNDYLSMENLRSTFTYQVQVDLSIERNTEIPAMLLQPFVENAIKHGVASKPGLGNISVIFKKSEEHNLNITIEDNGSGFNPSTSNDGSGLKLARKSINLLTKLYPECPAELAIHSDTSGTIVKISLNQWL